MGPCKSIGGVTTRYVYGDYRVNASTGEAFVYYRFAGRAVAWSGNSFVNYLLADHLASSQGEANASGAQVGQRRYRPFGSDRPVSGASDLTVDERFTAQRRLDAGGGNANRELYHYGARWYLPGVGIFTQPDLLGPGRRNPQTFNRYGYVLNNPVRFADPTGLQEDDSQEPTEEPVAPEVMEVIADQPNWFDIGWQWEFREANGRGPEAADYLGRYAGMAQASGMLGDPELAGPTPVAAPTPVGTPAAPPPEPEPGEPGVTHLSGLPALAVWALSGGKGAMTFGSEWTLATGPMTPRDAAHEAGHREHALEKGWWYAPDYVAEQLLLIGRELMAGRPTLDVHRYHSMEREADIRAGLRPRGQGIW